MEARAISALNHPNIVTIHDVGEADGINFIATEFVEGKTLRDLIGAHLKLKEILGIALQVCDALSAAHNAGIIHRDIKPENIMLRPDGYVKILDFGLVKLSEIDFHTMRNFTKTAKGIIIGTPAYMSPEQVADDNVDHRTDLWSVGVVLYELLTGTNPFKKENRQATFQAILSQDPPLAGTINAEIPGELDMILVKALEKDADLSYQTASDLRADLKRVKREIDSSPSWSRGSPAAQPLRTARSYGKFLAFGLLILPLLAAAIWFLAMRPADSSTVDWAKSNNVQLTDAKGTEYFPSLSPDGKEFVFASDARGNLDIYLQRVSGKNPENLTPDSVADDTMPAFSPDGERIAFRSEREPAGIYVMGLGGENLRRVADFGFHPSWSPDGKEIVVSTFGRDQPTVRASGEQALWIVDVETGTKRELLKVDASFPAWSPAGKRVAYWFYTGNFGRRDIATVAADGGEPVVVAKDFAVSNWNPVWSPDGKYLYFVSNRSGNMNFWRVRIDETTGAIEGEPEPVVAPSKYSRHLNFSRDGKRMIYVQTNNQSNIRGVEFDAKALRTVGAPFWITEGDRDITRAELSPDGTRFQLRLNRRTQEDIATVSRDGRDWRDVTDDPAFQRYSRWSPDGKQLAFSSDRGSGGNIWMSNPDGTNLRQITFPHPQCESYSFPVFAPDGKRLSINCAGKPYILDLTKNWDEQTPQPISLPDGVKSFVAWDWSPDGRKMTGTIQVGEARVVSYFSFETNDFTRLIENADYVTSWLPDSRHLVYGARDKVVLIDSQTKKTSELLTNQTTLPRSAFVSRDGRLLYFTAYTYESDIWLLDLSQNQ
jgi:serine/threonine protein kinase/sugar lactone lactonase YvrE